MKVGDLVMFNNVKSPYAQWFYGQLGIVESCPFPDIASSQHCRVTWLQPVRYFDSFSTYSDFKMNDFEVCDENR